MHCMAFQFKGVQKATSMLGFLDDVLGSLSLQTRISVSLYVCLSLCLAGCLSLSLALSHSLSFERGVGGSLFVATAHPNPVPGGEGGVRV